MSGHFIWNLWNEPLASFINFIWNDHECKILFIIWPFKSVLYSLQNGQYFNKKCIADTDFVNDVTSTHQSVTTRVVIRFLWHDVIHWITATSCDKTKCNITAKSLDCQSHWNTRISQNGCLACQLLLVVLKLVFITQISFYRKSLRTNIVCIRMDTQYNQGCHLSSTSKFPDFSLTFYSFPYPLSVKKSFLFFTLMVLTVSLQIWGCS